VTCVLAAGLDELCADCGSESAVKPGPLTDTANGMRRPQAPTCRSGWESTRVEVVRQLPVGHVRAAA